MMNSILRIGLSAALILLAVLPAEAAQSYCEATVSERLDRLNVDPSDIRGIYYDVQRHRGRNIDRVVSILAWVSLQSCKGSLVVDLSPRCRVRQVYGRGACNLGGAVETW
jgi:hypothetical protein